MFVLSRKANLAIEGYTGKKDNLQVTKKEVSAISLLFRFRD